MGVASHARVLLLEDDRAERDASGVCHAAAGLILVHMGLIAMFLTSEPFPLGSRVTTLRFAELAWLFGLLVTLWVFRKRPRRRLCEAVFLLTVLPWLLLSWVAMGLREQLEIDWEPLLRQKFIFFILALFSPARSWIAAIGVVLFAIESCLEYWVGGLSRSHHELRHEPWLTLFAAGLALALIVVRHRHAVREVALVQQVERLSGAARVARMALTVRDLANTPLQILEINLALLEAKVGPSVERFVGPMKRAVARLAELNEQLRPYASSSPPLALDAKELDDVRRSS